MKLEGLKWPLLRRWKWALNFSRSARKFIDYGVWENARKKEQFDDAILSSFFLSPSFSLSLCFPRYFAFMLKSLQILLSLPRVAPNFAKSDLSREFRNMCQTWRNPELPTFYGRHMQNILENIWRPKDFRFFGKIIKISKISIGKHETHKTLRLLIYSLPYP